MTNYQKVVRYIRHFPEGVFCFWGEFMYSSNPQQTLLGGSKHDSVIVLKKGTFYVNLHRAQIQHQTKPKFNTKQTPNTKRKHTPIFQGHICHRCSRSRLPWCLALAERFDQTTCICLCFLFHSSLAFGPVFAMMACSTIRNGYHLLSLRHNIHQFTITCLPKELPHAEK